MTCSALPTLSNYRYYSIDDQLTYTFTIDFYRSPNDQASLTFVLLFHTIGKRTLFTFDRCYASNKRRYFFYARISFPVSFLSNYLRARLLPRASARNAKDVSGFISSFSRHDQDAYLEISIKSFSSCHGCLARFRSIEWEIRYRGPMVTAMECRSHASVIYYLSCGVGFSILCCKKELNFSFSSFQKENLYAYFLYIFQHMDALASHILNFHCFSFRKNLSTRARFVG